MWAAPCNDSESLKPLNHTRHVRGEALLNEFAEIVKSSRRQKMKGSHVKRQLAQVADHWCHRCAWLAPSESETNTEVVPCQVTNVFRSEFSIEALFGPPLLGFLIFLAFSRERNFAFLGVKFTFWIILVAFFRRMLFEYFFGTDTFFKREYKSVWSF